MTENCLYILNIHYTELLSESFYPKIIFIVAFKLNKSTTDVSYLYSMDITRLRTVLIESLRNRAHF